MHMPCIASQETSYVYSVCTRGACLGRPLWEPLAYTNMQANSLLVKES